MKAFTYERARSPAEATAAAARTQGAKFIAGGTNLLDLMKLEIETPVHLIDVNGLALDKIEATPEGGLPLAPFGSVAVTETVKRVDVVVAGSGLTVLVGGVVSISQEADIEPVPKVPAGDWMPEALTVSTYVPSAVVRPDSPPI